MAELRRARKRDADLYIDWSFRRRMTHSRMVPTRSGPAGWATVTAMAGGVRITVWRAGPVSRCSPRNSPCS
jgi:hypothetical protein